MSRVGSLPPPYRRVGGRPHDVKDYILNLDSPDCSGHEGLMATIIEVAAAAGVSTATVSRVLSQPDCVSEKTRRHVAEVIDRLGYRPNAAARALRTLRVAKLLVTVPDISNPFFASVIRGAEEAARDAGYTVVLGDTRHDPLLENQYADMLGRNEVDGLIFLGHRLPESLRAMAERLGPRAPIVNGCEYSPDLGVPSVHIDNAAAAGDALDHLVAYGHSDIGVITGPLASPISRDRLSGALAAAERRGVRESVEVRTGDYSAQSGFDQATALLERGRTALFCFSDEMAIGANAAIRAAGLTCPDNVSLVGFDDISLARFFDPPLTTIAQPKEEIGRQAVRLTVDILNGVVPEATHITLPHELIVRRTTRARVCPMPKPIDAGPDASTLKQES